MPKILELAKKIVDWKNQCNFNTVNRTEDSSKYRIWNNPNKWLAIKTQSMKYIFDGMPGVMTPIPASQLLYYYLDLAESVKETGVYDCTGGCALALDYVLRLPEKPKISFAMVQFHVELGTPLCNHHFVILGLPSSKLTGDLFYEKILLPPENWGNDVVILDLWNKENPVYSSKDFFKNMQKLFKEQTHIVGSTNDRYLNDLLRTPKLDVNYFTPCIKTALDMIDDSKIWPRKSVCQYLTRIAFFVTTTAVAATYALTAIGQNQQPKL